MVIPPRPIRDGRPSSEQLPPGLVHFNRKEGGFGALGELGRSYAGTRSPPVTPDLHQFHGITELRDNNKRIEEKGLAKCC